jgi:hypothetical protein
MPSRKSIRRLAPVLICALLPLGCLGLGSGSRWKVHGGPQECVRMCSAWNLQFAGMVGVGNQEQWGDGATACICQVPGAPPVTPTAAATAATMAAPIAKAAEEERRREEERAEEAKRQQQAQEEEQKKRESSP